MTEIFSPNVELPKPPEAIGRAELEEVLRRARAPIIRGDFVEPWTEDPANFDPAQAGWEQAAGNLLTKIQEMQSSGLVQLTPEGLTPRQAAEKAGESAKLAEADKRAAELAEQLQRQQAAGNARRQPVEEPEPSPRDQWNQFADDQRNADLGEWYKKLQAGEPIEDWQKQALKDFNIWGGDSPPSAAEAEEPADEPDEEEVEGQVKSGLSKFLESVPWKRIVLEGTTIIPPMVFGGLLGYLDPETARNISLATGTAGIGLAFTSMAAAMAERILPAHVRAGLLGRALVGAKVAGMYGGNVFLSAAIGTHVGAGIREGIEVLHAAQPVSVGGGEGAMVDHPKPVDASIGQAGGLSPDVQPPADVATANEATQAAQAVAQQAAEAAEAARQAALQLGPTVAELAAQMPKQTVSEAIYQMIGDVPHRGEVTNVLFRAIGDKVNSLNEGAIKAAAEALRPVFNNIDKVVADNGTSYTEGGRAVVEIAKGFNSPEAQAIRAANMGDLEAAKHLFDNVIGPVIK